VSVSFVLLLIKVYGATVTEMVKSLRKARAPTLTRARALTLTLPSPDHWP